MIKEKVLRERDIEKYLVQQAKKAGGEVRKVQWIGRKDAPDRVVMLPGLTIAEVGLTIWAEVKRPGEVPRASQLREHARMRRAGQTVEVIDSLEAVDELLRDWI